MQNPHSLLGLVTMLLPSLNLNLFSKRFHKIEIVQHCYNTISRNFICQKITILQEYQYTIVLHIVISYFMLINKGNIVMMLNYFDKDIVIQLQKYCSSQVVTKFAIKSCFRNIATFWISKLVHEFHEGTFAVNSVLEMLLFENQINMLMHTNVAGTLQLFEAGKWSHESELEVKSIEFLPDFFTVHSCAESIRAVK